MIVSAPPMNLMLALMCGLHGAFLTSKGLPKGMFLAALFNLHEHLGVLHLTAPVLIVLLDAAAFFLLLFASLAVFAVARVLSMLVGASDGRPANRLDEAQP